MGKAATALPLVLVLAAAPACQVNERITGTIAGAAGGALVGGLLGSAVGSTAAGVVLGGVAGGAAGYIWGDYMADRRERACAPCPTAPPSPCAAPLAGDPAAVPAGQVAGVTGSIEESRSRARTAFEAGRGARTPSVALACYDDSIRLDPSRPEPHNAKGLVYLFQGKKADARVAFERALAVDPGYQPAQWNLRKLAGT
jgi:hypothetical protein